MLSPIARHDTLPPGLPLALFTAKRVELATLFVPVRFALRLRFAFQTGAGTIKLFTGFNQKANFTGTCLVMFFQQYIKRPESDCMFGKLGYNLRMPEIYRHITSTYCLIEMHNLLQNCIHDGEIKNSRSVDLNITSRAKDIA